MGKRRWVTYANAIESRRGGARAGGSLRVDTPWHTYCVVTLDNEMGIGHESRIVTAATEN